MLRRGVFFVLLSSLLLPTLSLGLGREKSKKKKKRRTAEEFPRFQRRHWRVVCAGRKCLCVCDWRVRWWLVWKHESCLHRPLLGEGRQITRWRQNLFLCLSAGQTQTVLGSSFFLPLPTGWYYGPRCYCAFVVCKCNFLPSCDDRYIFYKDIHICMWVSVSMLNPQVLLCENPPRFKAAILSSLSRQRFIWFGFHCWFCVAVTSCVLPVISTCYDCWLFIDLLPRNAATVSSSNTELKIIESGLKDSEEKLYQPPDSGGKVLFIFLFF